MLLDKLHGTRSAMKVLLNGYYGFGNFGDDLLMLCTYRLVRRKLPEAEISVFANNSNNLKDPLTPPGYRNYIGNLLGTPIALLDWTDRQTFDLIVHGGGGVFFDYEEGSGLDWWLNRIVESIGAGSFSFLLELVRALIRRRRNLTSNNRVGLGIGVGPYASSSKRLWREAETMGQFDRLAVRDADSQRWAHRLGLARLTARFTDLAFFRELWLETPRAQNRSGEIGLIICNGKPGNSTLLDILDSTPVDERWTVFFLDEGHDAPLIDRVRSAGHTPVVWKPWAEEINSFADRLRACDVIISNRAHGTIVGACVGVPSICIATDKKLISVHDMLPNGTVLMPPEDIKRELRRQIAYMKGNLCEYRDRLEADVRQREIEARSMGDYAFAGQ